MRPTEVIDRQYFQSIYFREPGGVLFELATANPGLGVDEHPSELGQALKLPPQYERYRERIAEAQPEPGDTAEALASISVAVDGEMAESSIGEGPDMEGVKFNETFIPSKDSGPGNFHTYTLELKSGQKVSTAANVRSGLDGELECTISVVDGGVLDQMDSSDSMTGHSASCSASVP